MSTSRDSFFSVNLRHLSPDCRRVGAELPDVQLNHLSVRQLRTLLDGAAKLAPTAVYPAEPQLRIEGTQGKFVVQLKNGTLNFISWSSSVRGTGAMTPAQVIGTILGEDTDDDEPVMAAASRSAGSGRRFSFSPTIAMYVVAIIGINSFTVWFLTRPPRTHLPSYTLLEAAPGERLLTEVAGTYETTGPGERRIEIRKDGSVHRFKYTAQRKIVQNQEFKVQPAHAAGQPALLTDRKSLITIKDPTSVVLYGDTYRRVAQP